MKTVDWHPQQGLLASGSKDSLIKLWDPKSPRALTSLHGHKGMVMMAKWNKNGNWLLSAARDQLCKVTGQGKGRRNGDREESQATGTAEGRGSPGDRWESCDTGLAFVSRQVFDLRMMKELASFRGHNKDVACCSWHPFHEELFASGGYDGSLIYWTVGHDKPQAEVKRPFPPGLMQLPAMMTGDPPCTDPQRPRHAHMEHGLASNRAHARHRFQRLLHQVLGEVSRLPPSLPTPTL